MTVTISGGITLGGGGLTFAPPAAGPTVIGEAYGGGYYAGKISTTGNGVATHYLIVAPKATGQATLQWKTTNDDDPGATSIIDGPGNTNYMNNASHPAAQFCKGLSIGGYTDWYMPAFNENIVLYYFLKPGTGNNDLGYGSNQYAVSPEPINTQYTLTDPAQTTAVAFQTGGAEAFSGFYWSSTQSTATNVKLQTWAGGNTGSSNTKNSTYNVRAVRRIPV